MPVLSTCLFRVKGVSGFLGNLESYSRKQVGTKLGPHYACPRKASTVCVKKGSRTLYSG